MRQWRLIYDMPMNGAMNMAVDEAILNSVSAGLSAPTLRLYRWQPACLSLGYGQRAGEVDLGRLAARGWTLVRRPTGGRAILHADELTYSLTLPVDHPLAAGGVIESYHRISEALLAVLKSLGAQPQALPKAAGAETGAVCFEIPSHYEITVTGKKLVGSAQVRRQRGMLQHGTLPLYGDIARICEVLHYESDAVREQAKTQVRARATTLENVLPSPPEFGGGNVCRGVQLNASTREMSTDAYQHLSATAYSECCLNGSNMWNIAAEAFVHGFEAVLGIAFENGKLTDAECEDVAMLESTKYGNSAWTLRR